ncbi:Ger(x)C family spore germination protein [Natroniella acetigena]|uniref:Ger(x)C family spore germination protein n=1 Tax=Natroniella acetigena TaxID=52004 RepID=UPI00200A4B9B|nr:Ger(x)C family spore germination protein [Natroniella acetigena]MCK8828292.1 Ger(x)C family spore germination protein [Natroniella acetigena]
MKHKLLIIYLLALLLSTGCWDINEIDRTKFPTYITIDQAEKDNFLFSAQFPIVAEEAPEETHIISNIAPSLATGFKEIQTRTIGWISFGMLSTIIFSQELAEAGLQEHIDALWRNPIAPGSLVLAISSERAENIKNIEIASRHEIGEYLQFLFETTARNSLLPKKTLNDFFTSFYIKGRDPHLPLLDYGTNEVDIIGTAVFQRDQLVGTLEKKETRALMLLQHMYSKGELSLEVEDYMVNYYVQEAATKLTPYYEDEQLNIKVDLELDVDLTEFTTYERIIDNPQLLEKVEENLAAALKKESHILFNKLQDYQSDILGIGQILKSEHPEDFDAATWHQDFALASVNVSVEVNLRRLGISS